MADELDELLDELDTDETPPEPPLPIPAADAVEAFDGTLPADIAAVWAVSPESELMARRLIKAQGLTTFRNSSVHLTAIKEKERDVYMEDLRAAYLKAQKAKQK